MSEKMKSDKKTVSLRLGFRAGHRGSETQQQSPSGTIFGDDSYLHSLCFDSHVGGGANPKEVL